MNNLRKIPSSYNTYDGYKVEWSEIRQVNNHIHVNKDVMDHIYSAFETAKDVEEVAAALHIFLGAAVSADTHREFFEHYFRMSKRWIGFNSDIKEILSGIE